MERTLWVSMPILRNIILGAAGNRQETEAICRAGGISVNDLDRADLRLSLEQNCALMQAAFAISGDRSLGLHIGEKTTQVVLGITGYLMESSPDVITALQNMQQYAHSFTRLFSFRVEIHGSEAWFLCEPLDIWNDISPDTARHSVDNAFAGAIHIIRLLTGRPLYPLRALYRYAPFRDTTEHERVLRCRLLFRQPCNGIVFSLQDLRWPVIGYNRELNGVFRRLLDEEGKKQSAGAVFSGEVRQAILQHYQLGFLHLEDVARILNSTPRTLQRKLKEEQTSFRAVLDGVKEELASQLLANPKITIAAIASRLGYSEPVAFQRAYRQWTGKTPGAYRKGLHQVA